VGLVLALLSSALWGTADFLGGTASRRLPPVTVVIWSEGAELVPLLVIAVALGGFSAPTDYLPWAVLGGLAGMLGIVAFYRALATGTMGVVAPIAALGVALPVFAGIAAGDRPSVLQDLGLAVAIFGVVLASGPELRVGADAPAGSRRTSVQPLLLACVAAVGFGLVFVALDHGAQSSTVMTLLVMRSVSLVVLLAAAFTTRISLHVVARDLPLLAVIGVFDVGANAMFAVATQHGLLALVAVLSSLYPAMTAVLAAVQHGERLGKVQLIGVTGAIAGVVLIASGGGG
jgi:drug/metabolite transporter (DMT)-like permease